MRAGNFGMMRVIERAIDGTIARLHRPAVTSGEIQSAAPAAAVITISDPMAPAAIRKRHRTGHQPSQGATCPGPDGGGSCLSGADGHEAASAFRGLEPPGSRL